MSGALRFAGYAALFGRRDAGRDLIRPRAFAQTLAKRRNSQIEPLPLSWHRRPDLRIGWIRTDAEDERELRVAASVGTPDGVAGLALRRGTLTGLPARLPRPRRLKVRASWTVTCASAARPKSSFYPAPRSRRRLCGPARGRCADLHAPEIGQPDPRDRQGRADRLDRHLHAHAASHRSRPDQSA